MSSGFSIEGLDEFEKDLEKMSKKAKDLDGKNEVSWDELFDNSFMAKHTKYQTIQELIDNSGFKIESDQDFSNIPDEEWDSYIQKVTEFGSWEDMQGTATEKYIIKQMGL